MRRKTDVKPDPQTSLKDTWTKLAHAIREIQNHNASKLSFEEHYRYAYNMVLFKRELLSFDGYKNNYQREINCTMESSCSLRNIWMPWLWRRSSRPFLVAAALTAPVSSAEAPRQ